MGKTSTLIYCYSNFENSELISEGLPDYDSDEFDQIFDFIENNTKKVPDYIVDNLIEFANNYY